MVFCPWLQDEPIEHESMLERHFIMAALSIPGLQHIQHQPFKFHLDVPAESETAAGTAAAADTAEKSDASTYVPDFLLRLVRKTLSNELPLDSKGTAAVRFSDLCFGLLKAFVDVHPFEINQRKLARPYDLFAESLDELPPLELPVDTRQLDLLACISKELTVSNEGVVHEHLRWNSHELQDLRRRTGHRFRAQVKIPPGELGTVFVQHIRSKEWLDPFQHPAEIIDGQHRFEGLRKAIADATDEQPATRLQKFELSIAIMFDLVPEECAKVFVTINATQRKVDSSHIADLFALHTKRSPQRVSHLIAVAANDLDASPFKGGLKMLGKRVNDERPRPLESRCRVPIIALLALDDDEC